MVMDDGWPPESQRHHDKNRTPSSEMSQEATISPPSIFHNQSPTSLFFAQVPPRLPPLESTSHSRGSRFPTLESTSQPVGTLLLPLESEIQSYRRRRTVHPHNPPMNPIHRSHDDLSEMSRPNPPPRLEHRASQTLIDLTDDNDEPIMERTRPRTRPQFRMQPLVRNSRNSSLDEATNVIDLTDDNDVEITRVTPRPLPSSPPINDLAPNSRENTLAPIRRLHRYMLHGPARGDLPSLISNHTRFHFTADHSGQGISREDFIDHIHLLEHAQAMVGHMDFHDENDNGAATHSRPDHVPPLAAKEGFTRSPTENDVVICPSCEEELIHAKAPDEIPLKKGGKTPTRKEREEHPFWVVKNCGHVYCNRCYQNRLPGKLRPEVVHFREKASTPKGARTIVPLCSVEECQSEVKNKDKWVGVFL